MPSIMPVTGSPRTPPHSPHGADDKFITSVERRHKRESRVRRDPPALTPVTNTKHASHVVPPTPNTASQMAGLLSPGYPLGSDPCRTACHAHPPAGHPQHPHLSHVAHRHDHARSPHAVMSQRERDLQDLGPDEYSYEFDTPTEDTEFDALLFISTLPAVSPAVANPPACPLPPKDPNAPRVTLVLDLDETLVHCTTDASRAIAPDFVFDVQFNSVVYNVAVNRRPYFREFLEWAAPRFEVVVFTASQRVYADKLLDILDPERRLVRHRVFRDSCICVEGNFLKDLTVLGRDLSRLVIVDNSPQAFSYQLDNGIPIESWFDCPRDRELLRLRPLLAQVAQAPDVREVLRRKFRLRDQVVERYARHKASLHNGY
eukprot:TRINITY_DN974_c0_g1_i1.p1 TRINITY_DN974_c0_g1~~TRINITY_DN974_c0_g1_i1.p1  ORF type:complete len:373 (+),score=54.24 TRINITY_DN974_c0_g1_i1:121-1239(+)